MATTTIRATVVNHNEIEIACPAATAWDWLLENIARARSYADRGYTNEPVDDRAAILSGRLRLEQDGAVDEIVYALTERDEAAMRMSVRAEFLSTGWIAFASYQVIPTERGCRFRIDCHTMLDVPAAPKASHETVRESVTAMRDSFDFGPLLETLKARFEADGEPA